MPECWLIHATEKKTRLCQTCFAMYQAIAELPYWIQLHQEWMKEERYKKRLKPGGDYFA